MIINYIIIFLFLAISYFPNFGSVDRSQVQWVSLNILNLLAFINIHFQKPISKDRIKIFLKSKIILSYTAFILISLISISYSLNQVESLVTFVRYSTIFLSLLILFYMYINQELKLDFIIIILALGAFLESLVINTNFLNAFDIGQEFGRSQFNKGLTSNINIAAFSMTMKVPFIVYCIIKYLNRNWLKILGILILSTILFSIYLTGSRGALLAIYIQLLSCFIFLLITKGNFKKQIKRYFIVYLLGFLISLVPNGLLLDTLSVAYRTQQIIERGSASRITYYKQAIESIIEKPFFGNGIGTWKIKSIYFDRFSMEGYTVQYNAHNDFLQIFTEVGLFGVLSYLLVFLITFKIIIKNVKSSFYFPLLLFLITYLIDANLNFPIDRPIIQIMLILLIPIVILNEKQIS